MSASPGRVRSDSWRLVVHMGTRKTATTHLQNAIGRNEALLRECGIHVPAMGRFSRQPRNVGHHNLAFQWVDPARFDPRAGGWDDLERELADVDAATVLMSSEVFERATQAGFGEQLLARLTGLGRRLTVVLYVRDTFSFLNSLYNQYVKMFAVVDSFRDYVRATIAARHHDLPHVWRHLLAAGPEVDVVIRPHTTLRHPHPLGRLLLDAGLEVDVDRLDVASRRLNLSLDAIGVEATRITGKALIGLHDDFDARSPHALQLHMESSAWCRAQSWDDRAHWGWDRALLDEFGDELLDPMQRFAAQVWGTDWPDLQVRHRPGHRAVFESLPSEVLVSILAHVDAISARWVELQQVHA